MRTERTFGKYNVATEASNGPIMFDREWSELKPRLDQCLAWLQAHFFVQAITTRRESETQVRVVFEWNAHSARFESKASRDRDAIAIANFFNGFCAGISAAKS